MEMAAGRWEDAAAVDDGPSRGSAAPLPPASSAVKVEKESAQGGERPVVAKKRSTGNKGRKGKGGK